MRTSRPSVGKVEIADVAILVSMLAIDPVTLLWGVGHRASSSDRDLGPCLSGEMPERIRRLAATVEARPMEAWQWIPTRLPAARCSSSLTRNSSKAVACRAGRRGSGIGKLMKTNPHAPRQLCSCCQTQLDCFIFWKHRDDESIPASRRASSRRQARLRLWAWGRSRFARLIQ